MPQILGLVLAGGNSSRMGRDKALLKPWGDDGPTLLGRAFSLLSAVTDACHVSCAPGRSYPPYPAVFDAQAGLGPASGVLAGLQLAQKNDYQGILTLPCDMPAMRRAPLLRLIAAFQAQKPWALCFEPPPPAKIQMLTAIYSVDFLHCLQTGLARGQKSLFWLVPPERRQTLPYAEAEARLFRNCNTAADLRGMALEAPLPDWPRL